MIVACGIWPNLKKSNKFVTKIYGIIPLLLKADLELNVGLIASGEIENISDMTLRGFHIRFYIFYVTRIFFSFVEFIVKTNVKESCMFCPYIANY